MLTEKKYKKIYRYQETKRIYIKKTEIKKETGSRSDIKKNKIRYRSTGVYNEYYKRNYKRNVRNDGDFSSCI